MNYARVDEMSQGRTMERTGRILTEAERPVARYTLLTTGQVAARLSDENVDADTVRSWCAEGRLKSVDGRKQGATRPYYLVDWRWVEEFIEAGGGPTPRVHHDAA
jgi:hypothetical protein